MNEEIPPTNIELFKQYIIRSVGYLKLPDNFKKQFGNIKKYDGEPEVTATTAHNTPSHDTLTISYTFRIDPETQKIIQEE